MGPKYSQIFCVLKSKCSFIGLVLSYFLALMYLFSRCSLGVPGTVHALEELVYFAQ